MAHPLVLGVFDSLAGAAHAARAVHALGVSARELSVVARDHEEEGELARALDASPGVEIEDSRLAGRLGELGAYLVAAVAVGVPGLGPIVTAGPLSAELGEAAGHVAGGLGNILGGAGVSAAVVADWESRIRKGDILLAVHATPTTSEAVRGAFEQSGAQAVTVAIWQ
ncbi:MAG: hypothetical protein AB7I50_12480 [Vicinamibacterales bacterium]